MAAKQTSCKDIKFTICHRTTLYNYTHVTFTEDDFIKSLSSENKTKWLNLTDDERKSIWNKLKKEFPFDVGTHKEYDPHTNWVEAWDTEEEVTTNESWDFHTWVKEEITNTVNTIDLGK